MERMEKINEQVKREISQILQQEFQDPQFMFITITGVKVSPDLHYARVHFSVLGNEDRIDELTQRLQQSRGYIRRLVAQRIRLRYIPEIQFIYDPSIAHSARIEQTLQEIHREQEEGRPPSSDETPA